MVKGLVIPADPELPIELREFNKLEDYQAAVGGWIEAVDVPPLGITTYVNEEGLLRKLPFNSRATFLWWYELPHVRHQAMLVGDAVVVGLPDGDGDGESTSIPESTLGLLTNQEQYAVMVLAGDSSFWVSHPFPYDDFLEAVVWAMILYDRVTDTRDVRVVTLDQLHNAEFQRAPQEDQGNAN
jgi:hypothetical protein